MGRNWTWIDENAERTDEEIDRVTPLLDELARQWSALHDSEEQQRFARQADIEDGWNDRDYDDYEQSEAEMYRDQQVEALHDRQHAVQVDTIETALAEHGARMMRPYEHWNEDEHYMQYMECDRFGDSCY
jgi:N-acyl-D-aspartate/D-glutamate deacylase